MFIRIQGELYYLWRAVDQVGVVLNILMQSRRDAGATKRFFKRPLKGLQYVPRIIVTDKLRGYGVAQRALLPDVEHRQSRYLNNRAENSHRPTRRREWQMQRFKSARHDAALPLASYFQPRLDQDPEFRDKGICGLKKPLFFLDNGATDVCGSFIWWVRWGHCRQCCRSNWRRRTKR